MMRDPNEEERIARKVRDRHPLSDDDHAAITAAWFHANPDPKFKAELRENLARPEYQRRIRSALNAERLKRGQAFVSQREFERIVYVMKQALGV